MTLTGKEQMEMTPGERWKEELSQAKEYLRPWHDTARAILKRLKDQRSKDNEERRVNLFTAEYLTKRAILYGKTPQVSVSRRWKDAADDVARVAGEMLGRHLNDEVASGVDGYERALGYALEDRLHVGMGQARVRYEVDFEEVQPVPLAPGVELEAAEPQPAGDAGEPFAPDPEKRKVPGTEKACVDYVFWEDFLWSPCRYWEVVRWVAFKAEMSRAALTKRFGAKGASIPLDATRRQDAKDKERQMDPPWGRATVWEVWDKEEKQVVWVTEAGQVLDTRRDPYELEGFFPCPRPLFALITTDEMVPRPDFTLAEDIYKDLDTLATRMHLLRTALRVVGVYDASNTELGELMNDEAENRMVPVKNWALFGEKGGLAGAVDFFPVQQVAQTLVSLSAEYEALKSRLYEVTGMSDILRGQGSAVQTTYGEQRIKAQFGSARLQAVQDEFARFATELQRLKAEVIRKRFDPEEIIRASNMEATPDAPLAPMAVALLKSDRDVFRVKVQPEALALADFAAVKEERMEVIAALATFVSAITPLLQMTPQAMPVLLEILKWLVSSLRGSSEIEGVLDRALQMAQQAAQQPAQPQQPPPPDPKLLQQQMKGAQDLAKIEAETKANLMLLQAEVQADAMREENQRKQNVQEAMEREQVKVQSNFMRGTGGAL
jgi:hypothetical protein